MPVCENGNQLFFQAIFILCSLSRNDLNESTGATVAGALENLSQLEMF